MDKARTASRWLLAVVMVVAGANHFLSTDSYMLMMPAMLPFKLQLLWLSGVLEIVGGLGLLHERTRLYAVYGLIALLLAVFPANINQAMNNIVVPGLIEETWQMWARLPAQAVFIGWAWWVRHDPVK